MPSVTESDGKPVASTTPAAAPPVSTAKPSEDKQIALKPVEPTPQRPSSSRPREITNVPADPASQTAKASTPNAEKPPEQEAPKPASQPDSTANTAAEQKANTDTAPLSVGSLADFATSRATPVYPAYARNAHAQGVVRVEVIVDETGEVASIEKTSGPSLLQAAAKDAIKKWRFKPFERDGQPVKASGFVNFNFSL
jgi:protein TonB